MQAEFESVINFVLKQIKLFQADQEFLYAVDTIKEMQQEMMDFLIRKETTSNWATEKEVITKEQKWIRKKELDRSRQSNN